MKYAMINEIGLVTAFYSDDIHSDIPNGAVSITDEQWIECINNNGNRKFVNGELVEYIKVATPEQLKVEIESAIQSMLDDKAQLLRYDSMLSARSYAGFVNPFQAEAEALAVWCAKCWIKAGELEALGTAMTVEEVVAQMPIY